MALTDVVLTLAGLLEIELPSKTIRLCDGGFVSWPAKGTFQSQDDDFGTLGEVEAVSEGISDEAPGGRLVLYPPSIADSADLFIPTAQGSPIRAWVAEVNTSTNAVVGTPVMQFDGIIDTLEVNTESRSREVVIEFVDAAERLFMVREGNVLSPRWHKSIWPAELGLDFATGIPLAVPWGVPGPGRGSSAFGSSVLAAAIAVGGVSGGGGSGGVSGGKMDSRPGGVGEVSVRLV